MMPAGAAPTSFDPAWTIVEGDFDPATFKAHEGLFTLGSGYLHVRGSFEEHLADAPQNRSYTRRPADVTSETFADTKSRWGTYVPGIYGAHPLLNNELINLPWFLDLTVEADGRPLDVEHCRIDRYQRMLNLATVTLQRSLRWHTPGGTVIDMAFQRFISGVRPHIALQRLELTADQPLPVTIRAGVDADVRTNGYDHFASAVLSRAGRRTIACRVQTDRGDEVTIASAVHGPVETWQYRSSGRRAALGATVTLQPGRPAVIEKRSAVATSRDRPFQDPQQHLAEIESLDYDALWQEHARHWQERWESCDVAIDGDEESQRAVRASIFHLLRAHPGDDVRVAIDAKGYSGEAYWGRFFWDTEMFLLPFYLYTSPARARTLVDFRLNTLPGARANARRGGCSGARYPWESDAEGNECCPNPQYANHEVHITADVAYGLAHYAAAADDASYLRGPAAEAIVETARYWLDRITTTNQPPRATLADVMGPDEYTPVCRDNAYTNRLAAFALNLASEVGEAGGASSAERSAFAETARRLPVLRHPDDPCLVLQCEGFHRLGDPRFEELWRDRSRPFAAQVPCEHLHRSRCLKQADVLMLMMLFADEFSDDEVRRAWEYYVPVTTHDSSLSAGVHAIIAARLGLHEEAWSFWRESSMLDLDAARGGAAEGIHIANAGAVWQMIAFGFAGMKSALHGRLFTLSPRLPKTWRRLSMPLIWRGRPLLVDIDRDAVQIGNRSLTETLPARACGREHVLAPGAVHRWSPP